MGGDTLGPFPVKEMPDSGHAMSTAETGFNYENPKTVNTEFDKLPWWKFLLLEWRGFVSVGKRWPKNFTAPTEFFLLRCHEGGHVILTYEHGHDQRIECSDHQRVAAEKPSF